MKINRLINYMLVFTSFLLIQCKMNETNIIQKNTYPINSISPTNNDYSDLVFLNGLLKNKQIVLIGESSHGDGATFEAKTRLIKYLHENLDYNVIAFEGATIFDLFFASSVIKRGKTTQIATQQLKSGIYYAWSGSREFQGMANFIGNNIDSLSLIGIDNNFTASPQHAHFSPKFLDQAFNISLSPEINYENFQNLHNRLLTNPLELTSDTTFNKEFIKDVERIKKIISESSKGSVETRDYIIHELDNLISFVNEVKIGLMETESVISRDRQMAENLFWAIENYYPNEKIIIWTANFHAAKNLDQAMYATGDDLYQTFTTLAQHISKKYGEEKVYSIACTSSEGETNSYPEPIPISAPETSWEYMAKEKIKNDFAFIDFTQIRKTEFGDNQFESTILGYKPHVGKWYNIFDGVLFIKNMKPSTFK